MFVCCVCVGSSLCDKLITDSEECYWVSNCVWFRNPYTWVRLLHHRKKKLYIFTALLYSFYCG